MANHFLHRMHRALSPYVPHVNSADIEEDGDVNELLANKVDPFVQMDLEGVIGDDSVIGAGEIAFLKADAFGRFERHGFQLLYLSSPICNGIIDCASDAQQYLVDGRASFLDHSTTVVFVDERDPDNANRIFTLRIDSWPNDREMTISDFYLGVHNEKEPDDYHNVVSTFATHSIRSALRYGTFKAVFDVLEDVKQSPVLDEHEFFREIMPQLPTALMELISYSAHNVNEIKIKLPEAIVGFSWALDPQSRGDKGVIHFEKEDCDVVYDLEKDTGKLKAMLALPGGTVLSEDVIRYKIKEQFFTTGELTGKIDNPSRIQFPKNMP